MKDFKIDISRQIINDKLNGLGFLKRNPSLTNFSKFSIESHYPNLDNMMFDASAVLINTLIDGVLSHVNSSINLQLMNRLDSLLDLRGLADINKIRAITNGLVGFKYHNMITNSRLAVELQDSPMFHSNAINRTSNQIYNVGVFNQNNLYVDPYIAYADYRIVFFDNIDINVDDIKLYEKERGPDNYNRSLIIDFMIDFRVNNKHLVGVIDDINADALSNYRETKIDDIMNGDI